MSSETPSRSQELLHIEQEHFAPVLGRSSEVVVDRAQGSYMWSVDGTRYLDFAMVRPHVLDEFLESTDSFRGIKSSLEWYGYYYAAGPTLAALVSDQRARLVYHPMNFLDAASTTRYSTRASAASGCASDQGKFTEYMHALFVAQPPEGGPGLSDDELIQIGAATGVAVADFTLVTPYVELDADTLAFAGWLSAHELLNLMLPIVEGGPAWLRPSTSKGWLGVMLGWLSPARAFAAGLVLGVVESAIASGQIFGHGIGPSWREVLPIGFALLLFAQRTRLREPELE